MAERNSTFEMPRVKLGNQGLEDLPPRCRDSKEDVEEISNAVPIDEVAGCRTGEALLRISWKFANSPPKNNT